MRPVQNRVKTATDTPADNTVVQTTTTRRVIPVDSSPRERTTPDFWDYIENLKPEQWSNHIVYMYRMDPRSSNYGDGQSSIDKFVGYIEMPEDSVRRGWPRQVPFDSREEIDLAIREKHGGKAFRLIIKRGSERVTEGKSTNDAPPKFAAVTQDASSGNGPMVSPYSEANATAQIANKAIDTMAGQEHQAVNLGLSMMNTAATVVRNFADQGRSAPIPVSETDQLVRMMMMKMMEKMIDRMDRTENQAPVVAGQNPMVDRLLNTALERLLVPVQAGPGPINAGAELVRQLPSVAGYISEAIKEWRMGSEAQRDTAAIMRQQPPPNGAPKGATSPTMLPPAPQNPQPPANAMTTPSLEFIESKIVEILKEPLSASEAADEAIAFLDRMDAQLIRTLANLGEPGLVQLFQNRPVLKQATANMPRLLEFIAAFVKYANKDESIASKLPN